MSVPLSRTIQYLRSQLRSYKRFISSQETAVHKKFDMADDIKQKLAKAEADIKILQEASALQQRSAEFRRSHQSTIIFDKNKAKFIRRTLVKAREAANRQNDDDSAVKINRMLDLMDDIDIYINDSPVFTTYRSAFKNVKGSFLDGYNVTLPERTEQLIAQTKVLRRLIDSDDEVFDESLDLPEPIQIMARGIVIYKRLAPSLQSKHVAKEKAPLNRLLRGTAVDDDLKEAVDADLADDDFFEDA